MPATLNPKAVLFDFYGTLADICTDERRPMVWKILASFLRYQGVDIKPDILAEMYFDAAQRLLDEATHRQKFPEISVREAMRSILQKLGYTKHDKLDANLVKLLRPLTVRRLTLFPDTHRVLEQLRPMFKLAVVSDAQREYFDAEIRITGIETLWDVVVLSSDFGYRKPDPRLFTTALERLGVSYQEAVFVGDNVLSDVCGARDAGIYAVLIDRTGNRTQTNPACIPDQVFANLDDLAAWLVAR